MSGSFIKVFVRVLSNSLFFCCFFFFAQVIEVYCTSKESKNVFQSSKKNAWEQKMTKVIVSNRIEARTLHT